METVVAVIFTKFEECSGHRLGSENDVCGSCTVGGKCGALSVIRSDILHNEHQVCVSLGERKWRLRRSMNIYFARVTSTGTPCNVSCTCATFRTQQRCVHVDAIYKNTANEMRMKSIVQRSNARTNGNQYYRAKNGV